MSYDPAYQRQYYLARREALCQQQRDLYDCARDTKRKRAWVHHNRQHYQRYQATYYQMRRKEAPMTADEFTTLRTASGWTRTELAGLMECSPQAIGRWERGTRRISPGVALQVRTVPKKPPGKRRKKRGVKS